MFIIINISFQSLQVETSYQRIYYKSQINRLTQRYHVEEILEEILQMQVSICLTFVNILLALI